MANDDGKEQSRSMTVRAATSHEQDVATSQSTQLCIDRFNQTVVGVCVPAACSPRSIRGCSIGLGSRVGLAGAWVATSALRSMLFGVSPTEPIAFAVALLALALVALIASWLPARAATRVTPLEAVGDRQQAAIEPG